MNREKTESVEVKSRKEWRQWLELHHSQSAGVWLVTYKKQCQELYVAEDEIVQECLCFGWIDGVPRKVDEERTSLYVSPRREGSRWSRKNKAFVEALEASGEMTTAGRFVVDRAKADGTWNALDEVEDLVVPPDLQEAFDQLPGSETTWHDYPRSVKRGALERLLDAKRAATRRKRIDVIIAATQNGERPFQSSRS